MQNIQIHRGGSDPFLSGLADACAKRTVGMTDAEVAALIGRKPNAEFRRLMVAVRKRRVDRRYDSVSRLFQALGLRLDGIQVSIEIPAPGLDPAVA